MRKINKFKKDFLLYLTEIFRICCEISQKNAQNIFSLTNMACPCHSVLYLSARKIPGGLAEQHPVEICLRLDCFSF